MLRSSIAGTAVSRVNAPVLAGPAGEKILPYSLNIGITLLWVAAVVTLYTGYDYFRAGMKHVIEE